MASSITASGARSIVTPSALRRVPVKFRKTVRKRKAGTGPLLISGRRYPTLSLEAWNDLHRIRHMESFPAGSTVFVEGQPCRGVYILHQGRAKLNIANSDGKTLIIRIVGPGEILALNPCLTGGIYDMTLVTTQPTEFAFVRRNEFLQFLNDHRDASYLAGEQLIRDYREAYDLVRSIGLAQTTNEKLARFLLHWATEASTGDGAHFLRTRFTHDEIGQMIGLTRETVTRALGLLKRDRVIEFSGSGLLIRDMTALEQMVS